MGLDKTVGEIWRVVDDIGRTGNMAYETRQRFSPVSQNRLLSFGHTMALPFCNCSKALRRTKRSLSKALAACSYSEYLASSIGLDHALWRTNH
jgi:hypothetical protein